MGTGRRWVARPSNVFTAYCLLPTAYSKNHWPRRADVRTTQPRRNWSRACPIRDLRAMHAFARHGATSSGGSGLR